LKKIFFYLLLPCLALSACFLLFTLEGHIEPRSASSEDIRVLQQLSQQARAFLRDPADNSRLQISHTDLQSLFNVASDGLKPVIFHGAITDDQLLIHAVAPLPAPFSDRMLLFSCWLEQQQQGFAIEGCLAGRVPVAGSLTMWLLRQSFAIAFKAPDDQLAFQILLSGQVSKQVLSFAKAGVLQHQPELSRLTTANSQLGMKSVQGALGLVDVTPYLELLSKLHSENPSENQLAFYLQQLLQAAASKEHDFHTESTSAIWALAIAAAERRFIQLTPVTVDVDTIPKLPRLQLGGREDLALHFLYSAAMRIAANPLIATKIGAFKELSDAGAGGSGFSFVDIAANKAGIWLVDNIAGIAQQQLFILNSVDFEAAFMPAWQDLPEGLTEAQLQYRFGGPEGEGSKALLRQIEQRLLELSLFRL
jgi:hypothetical protein